MLKFKICVVTLWAFIFPYLALSVTLSADGHAPERLKNASADELQAAIELVDSALEESAKRNVARLEHIRRNQYKLAPNTKFGRRASGDGDSDEVPQLLSVTPELAAAAALVAEAEIAQGNITSEVQTKTVRKRDGFWMETIDRKGVSPWADDPDYKVFRNVKDYGAKGDGSTDDTEKIQNAIKDGKRCGSGCNGSTTKNAIIYFPPGTYIVSRSIDVYFGTQLIGDANDRPLIQASSRFLGLGVFSTDKYTGDGVGADGKDNEWYINTANFYRQMRNFRIDITATRAASHVCGLHYQVAQATSLQNIEFIADSDKSQRGIFAENGSGGVMSDLTFTGGEYGIYGGSQQFTANRLTFKGCKTAVRIIWDWGWLWKSIQVSDGDTGFFFLPEKKSNESASKEDGHIGSAAFMESQFPNVKNAIMIQKPSDEVGTGTTGLVLNRVHFKGVDKAVADTDGNTILNEDYVGSWIMGPVYQGAERSWSEGKIVDDPVLTHAVSEGPAYIERPKPQYSDKSPDQFIHLRDYAKGDGSSIDSSGVQRFFDQVGTSNGEGKILFADAGVYLIDVTITIHPGTKVVGEAWTQFVATGKYFGNMTTPFPMFRVGASAGDEGGVEMQDLLFTSKGPTPGAILLQWNLKAKSKGGAAMWDCHFRLGGATGTELTPKECPALTNGEVRDQCIAASLMMHVTAGSTGYFDNVWLWVADHMIDDPDTSDNKNDMTQVSIYSARGLLVETKEGVLLYGTSSEHSVLYQYNFNDAENVFAGLLQTETPYFQPKPLAPVPFDSSLGMFAGDPKYTNCEKAGTQQPGCDSSWGLIITGCRYLHVAAAGIYSFFRTYSQDCIDKHECQNTLVKLNENYDNVRIEQLITIGAEHMFETPHDVVLSTDNLAIKSHPSWSQISMINATTGSAPGDDDDGGIPDPEPCGENKYDTLEDLEKAIGTIPDHCIVPFALEILWKKLSAAVDKYHALLDADYDKYFGYYVEYIKKMVKARMMDFVWADDGEGNQYFDCTVILPLGGPQPPQQCPISQAYISNAKHLTIDYKLRDEDGFYDEILAKFGIIKGWVDFSYDVPGCKGSPIHCGGGYDIKIRHLPQANDSLVVQNPKDLVAKAMGGYRTIYGTLVGAALPILIGEWDGTPEDAIEVMMLPVSLAEQAVEGMKNAREIGEQQKNADEKALAVQIINIALAVIPFVGEFFEAFGTIGAALARVLKVAELAGNAGITLHDVVTDPASAPFDILGFLLGKKADEEKPAREGKEMAELAKKRRTFTTDQITDLGDMFHKNGDLVDKIIKRIKDRTCKP